MRRYFLPENGSFYKANLHCHSTFSDGKYTPEELKGMYKSLGYSVLAITDHEGLFHHTELNDKDFLTIAGLELEFDRPCNTTYDHVTTCHMCFYKKDPTDLYQPGYDPGFVHPKFTWTNNPKMRAQIKGKGTPFGHDYSHETINNAIKTMKDEGFIVTHNHPKWSLESYEDYILHEGHDNLEIYNHGTSLGGHDDRNGEVYDAFLRKGKKLFVTASDDNHGIAKENIGGFTMFKAPSLTYENIIRAFENGEFYASEGPEIEEFYIEDSRIVLKSKTPLQYVSLISGTRFVSRVAMKKGEPVFEANFYFKPDCKYVRLEACGLDGKKAYTNAYWVEEIL